MTTFAARAWTAADGALDYWSEWGRLEKVFWAYLAYTFCHGLF